MRPLYDARLEDLGPSDRIVIECVCGHEDTVTALLLTSVGVAPHEKVQDLAGRLRCQECDERGRAMVSVRWGNERQ